MAQESLSLTEIQDHVDIDEGEAWLQFKCQGKPVRMDCEVQDDWVDTGLFGHFVDLLVKYDPKKLFIYYNLAARTASSRA